ncbi:universal stress protein [Agromyces bauzanensis]|uniref:Universal stress protein n=1 Tax=Agromyces bauzanensis TaxID=1308924 RepID=A0A917PKN8_9MICO|nr:universal stress protein [Agromyces bauzanensis]GGJ82019.1 universal stress protein [Agromyces bauzanensis]
MSETNEQTGRKPFIVAGADGTDASIHALKWAVGQARMTGAKLIVIAAWEVPWTIMVSPTSRDEDYAQHAKALLDRSVEEGLADAGDLEVEVRMVEWRPTLALVEAAEGAQMLVLGSHRYGAVEGAHLGSVASYCAHHAPCPVLIHRHS